MTGKELWKPSFSHFTSGFEGSHFTSGTELLCKHLPATYWTGAGSPRGRQQAGQPPYPAGQPTPWVSYLASESWPFSHRPITLPAIVNHNYLTKIGLFMCRNLISLTYGAVLHIRMRFGEYFLHFLVMGT